MGLFFYAPKLSEGEAANQHNIPSYAEVFDTERFYQIAKDGGHKCGRQHPAHKLYEDGGGAL